MHRLIIGPGALSRFYKVFTPAFAAYSAAWITGWMKLGGHPGSLVGLLAGAILMGLILSLAFDASNQTLKVIAAIFLLNSAGYFIGGWVESAGSSIRIAGLSRGTQMMIAKSLWGVCYGAGFGAGLGLAFFFCQAKTRAFVDGRSTNLAAESKR